MNNHELLDLFGEVSDRHLLAADEPPRRRGNRAVRAGLIAACLCMVLAGTAAAVQSGAFVQFIQGNEGLGALDDGLGFDVAGYYEALTVERIPVEEFSEAVRSCSEALGREPGYCSYGFETWEEGEAFLGMDVLNNVFLESLPMQNMVQSDGAQGRCIVSVGNNSDTGEFVSARITGSYGLMGQRLLRVTANLVTELNLYSNGGGTILAYDEAQLAQVNVEEYTAASGAAVTIIRDEMCYTAFLSVGRALVSVTLDIGEDEAESLSLLKTAVDAFV